MSNITYQRVGRASCAMRSIRFERVGSGTDNYAAASRTRTFIGVAVGLKGAWLLASGPMILPMKHAYMNEVDAHFLSDLELLVTIS